MERTVNIAEEYYSQERDELMDFIPSGVKKVLDVGCGEAFFTEKVKKKFDAEAWGVELVDAAANVARTKLDKVITGGFHKNYNALPKGYFDCVFFNDVLEHVINPEEVLAQSKALLSDNGVIICSIPNVRFFRNLMELLIEKDWRYKDGGILDRTHVRFFTLKSIKRMFQGLDFDVIEVAGIHPIKSSKVRILYYLLNGLTLGAIQDTFFMQYACIVKPKSK